MQRPLVIVAHTRASQASAREVVVSLSKLGYRPLLAQRGAASVLRKKLAACRRLIVLDDVTMPRAAASRAEVAGKLLVMSANALPRGPSRARQWRGLIEGGEAASPQKRNVERVMSGTERSADKPSRWGALLMTILLAGVAGAAGYAVNPAFAGRVDAIAHSAQTQANALVSELKN